MVVDPNAAAMNWGAIAATIGGLSLLMHFFQFMYARHTAANAATATELRKLDVRVSLIERTDENAPSHADLQKLHDRISLQRAELSEEIDAFNSAVAAMNRDMGELTGQLKSAQRLVELLNAHHLKNG